jgi:hypothetical protein
LINFLTANAGQHSPIGLTGIGFTHPRRFVGYAEIDDRAFRKEEVAQGCEIRLDGEALGGPDDGWLLDLESARVLPKARRLSKQFMVIWRLRLPPGDWKLRLWIGELQVAERTIEIREV